MTAERGRGEGDPSTDHGAEQPGDQPPAPVDAATRVARRCADLMWAGDRASQALGMELLAVAPGRATLAMTVREDMVNGHEIGHGGFTFTLADSAFAFACNSYNRRTVAQVCEVQFLAPTRLGDRLVADAVERHREGRDGVYDVTVRTSDAVVAEFVGHSKEIRGTFFDEEESTVVEEMPRGGRGTSPSRGERTT